MYACFLINILHVGKSRVANIRLALQSLGRKVIYDLSVLSMSVMGFQSLDGGWVDGVSSIQVYFEFFLTLQSP